MPEGLDLLPINMNTEFLIKVDYEKEIDKAYFNIVLLYNYDIVGTKSYQYNQMKYNNKISSSIIIIIILKLGWEFGIFILILMNRLLMLLACE